MFYAVAIGLIASMAICSRILVGKDHGILQWLGRNSLAVMCIHEPLKRILLKISAVISNIEIGDIRQSVVLSVLVTVLVIATCLPIVMLMRRYTPLFIGMKSK